MANRYTDTKKWSRSWFRQLRWHQKLFWLYLCDYCDHAGIWIEDFETASLHVGHAVSPKDYSAFGSRLRPLPDGKIWVSRFVEFQYSVGPLPEDKKLNPANKVHLSVIQVLDKHGIDSAQWRKDGSPLDLKNNPTPSPFAGSKDKEKDKYKEKEEGGTGGECRQVEEVIQAHSDPEVVGLLKKWFRGLRSVPPVTQ